MTGNPNEPRRELEDQGDAPDDGAPGVETTTSEDGGSTFEPEEDPEGHAD